MSSENYSKGGKYPIIGYNLCRKPFYIICLQDTNKYTNKFIGRYWAAIDATVRFWHKVAINDYLSRLKADIHILHKLSELHLEIL